MSSNYMNKRYGQPKKFSNSRREQKYSNRQYDSEEPWWIRFEKAMKNKWETYQNSSCIIYPQPQSIPQTSNFQEKLMRSTKKR